MASSLELGKLVGASFLYRYWKKINWLMKTYLITAVVVLVFITSAGIFGFLSNAYQGATIEFEKQSTTLIYKEDRLEQLVEDKVYLKEELVQSIASLPDNYITAKRKLREEYNPKVLELNDQILNIKQEVSDLKVVMIETGVDVGPAIYLARAFNTDIDTVVKFFIFILIFVFDPLAVSLVLATNVALAGDGTRDKKILQPLEKKIKKEVPIPPINTYGDDDWATPPKEEVTPTEALHNISIPMKNDDSDDVQVETLDLNVDDAVADVSIKTKEQKELISKIITQRPDRAGVPEDLPGDGRRVIK